MPPTIQDRRKFAQRAYRQLGIFPKINYGDDLPQHQKKQIQAMQQQQRERIAKQLQARRVPDEYRYPTFPQKMKLFNNALAQLSKQSTQSQHQPVAGRRGLNPRMGAIRRKSPEPQKPQLRPQQPKQFRPRSGAIIGRRPQYPKKPQVPAYVSAQQVRRRKAQAAARRGAQPVAGQQSHYAVLKLNPSTGRPRRRQQQQSPYATILNPSSSQLARTALQKYQQKQALRRQHAANAADQQRFFANLQKAIA